MRSRFARSVLRIAIVLALIAAAAYALGGRSTYRTLRLRIVRLLEPPTKTQMQSAAEAAAVRQSMDSLVRAEETRGRKADKPASLGFAIAVVAIALTFVLVALVASTVRR